MDFAGGISEVSEASEIKGESNNAFSSESLDKFDKIMGDDKIPVEKRETPIQLSADEMESKFSKLFDAGDFFKKPHTGALPENTDQKTLETSEILKASEISKESVAKETREQKEPNSEYELNGDIYETDDNGDIYKKNGEMLPNTEYTVNGNKYKTDEHGNKISCDSEPSYTEDGTRNIKEQRESGGEERQEDDDGGHIIAKILGGAEGEENLVAMRRTINRGDYKKMENEIAKALQEGKKVVIHIDIVYDGDSKRPSKIRSEYTIDGKKTVVEFDNKENSIELLDYLKGKISNEDYDSLREEIEDMKEDGVNASVTSVKAEYDEDGRPVKITVGILDESTGKKTYKVYEPR